MTNRCFKLVPAAGIAACLPKATSPIITPFNGEQNAGIQALNTSNFPTAAGPLSRVHR